MKRKFLTVAGIAAALGVSTIALAQQPPAVTPMTPEMNPSYSFTRPEADFIRKEVMIPMRDGTKLFTVIAMKKGTAIKHVRPAVQALGTCESARHRP